MRRQGVGNCMAMPYTTRWGTKHRATDQRHDYTAQSVVYQKLLENEGIL